jgi:hypothetical protein
MDSTVHTGRVMWLMGKTFLSEYVSIKRDDNISDSYDDSSSSLHHYLTRSQFIQFNSIHVY